MSGAHDDAERVPDLFGDDVTPRSGIGGHHEATTGNDEWLTPPEVLAALGPFDLDPCAPALLRRPWRTAARHYCAADDGLRQPWQGRVWLNPPYSTHGQWLARLADHPHGGTALIFARTETRAWFTHVWPRATGILFLRGRLHFHYVNGARAKANSGAPSALIAYGAHDATVLASEPLPGHYVPLQPT